MANAKTKIQWADRTWNPLRGCSRISPGCERCYAEVLSARFSQSGGPYEGVATIAPPRWTGTVRRVDDDKMFAPLRWRGSNLVFVNSMSDVFHEAVPDEWIDTIFAVMALAQRQTFMVLTKRADRMHRYMNDLSRERRDGRGAAAVAIDAKASLESLTWPLPNVWLGVSVEDQKRADERIPKLLDSPAALRFISAEPLLGPVDLERVHTEFCEANVLNGDHGVTRPLMGRSDCRLDWVITGGESGIDTRPCDAAWIGSIVAACRVHGVPVFVKQLGASPVLGGSPLSLVHGAGGNPEEWPDDLRVREHPVER